MVAALEAEANGASVALLDRGPIGLGTNSVLSNGIFAGPNAQCPYIVLNWRKSGILCKMNCLYHCIHITEDGDELENKKNREGTS